MEESINYIPSVIDNTNFRYIKVDDKYIASLVVYDYPIKISFAELIDSIEKKYFYDVSIYIQKLDTLKVLKEISYNISNYKSEIKTTNENQIDIDILNKQQLDSKELRKQIQLNNEEVYQFNFFLTFYSSNKEDLFKTIKSFQSKLFSRQIYSNITNFRNLDSYLLTLPLNNYNNRLIEKTYRNITTSTLCNIFPFYTRSVFDKNGIIFGYTRNENKLSIIDIFDSKYLNSNITILGSSGSGKSYFAKLIFLRHFFKNKIQYVFDIEGEYVNLANRLNIDVISFGKSSYKFINIMDIYDIDLKLYKNNVFNEKISEIIEFISKIKAINKSEENDLRKALIKAYLKKGITSNIDSLYIKNRDNEIFIEKKLKEKDMFPNMYDLFKEITDTKLKEKIKYIIREYSEFCNYTNVDFFSSLVFNTNNIKEDKMQIVTYYFLNKISKYLGISNNNKVIIYIDEVWKYIASQEKTMLSDLICSLYKSIRKNNASIVTITQDVSDFFNLKNGSYGKMILNNSEFKVFFKLEYSDTEILTKLNIMTKENLLEISRLEKGNMLLGFCNNIALLKVKTSKYENEIIEGTKNENISSS